MKITPIKAKIILKCQEPKDIRDIYREIDYNGCMVGLRGILDELIAFKILIKSKKGRVAYYSLNKEIKDKIIEIAKEVLVKNNDIIIDKNAIFN